MMMAITMITLTGTLTIGALTKQLLANSTIRVTFPTWNAIPACAATPSSTIIIAEIYIFADLYYGLLYNLLPVY
jgi:hypothetical protein